MHATQTDAILKDLEAGLELTPLDALNRHGCMRLGARIWDLKQQGKRIVCRRITKGGKSYGAYKLA